MTATYRRPFLVLDIAKRTKGYEMDVAAATDFATTLARLEPEPGVPDGLLPYCFDAAAERVLFTRTPDMARTLAAPFLYQAQYAGAEHLVSVPLERLDVEPAAPMTPTFVLSVSRCGSTLLSTLLHHARHPAASEPDIYTQLAAMPPDQRNRIGAAGRLAIIRGSTVSLAGRIGSAVVIKLRDHCNDIALQLAAAVPEARMAFMLRDRLAWANSRHRAFNDSPAALADILRRGVLTFDALARAGHCPLLIWYEDLLANPHATLARLDVPAAALDGAGLSAVLARDAQAGTSISQENTGRRRLSDGDAAGFEIAWAAAAPREALRRNGLDRLLPPGG